MIRRSIPLLILSLIFLTAGEKETNSVPFSLHIGFSDSLLLTATLKNISDSSYKYKHHKYAAPIELTIISENGDTLSFYDKREKMRYHFKPDLNDFQTLAPRDSAVIKRQSFEKGQDSLYLLNWDAFVFRSITPGSYTVSASWRSRIDMYYDSQKRQYLPVHNVWKGTVVSDSLTITLP